jgi:hypothetical protein
LAEKYVFLKPSDLEALISKNFLHPQADMFIHHPVCEGKWSTEYSITKRIIDFLKKLLGCICSTLVAPKGFSWEKP